MSYNFQASKASDNSLNFFNSPKTGNDELQKIHTGLVAAPEHDDGCLCLLSWQEP